ncbi:MAG: hypothetical protein QM526_02565 [Alphaproteobacteria bacterium]|nr:hypothetical protein [Alphaproteobacteria bacterium]
MAGNQQFLMISARISRIISVYKTLPKDIQKILRNKFVPLVFTVFLAFGMTPTAKEFALGVNASAGDSEIQIENVKFTRLDDGREQINFDYCGQSYEFVRNINETRSAWKVPLPKDAPDECAKVNKFTEIYNKGKDTTINIK